MASEYIPLQQDISRLINIFEAETKNISSKRLTIYSYQDKRLPPNPIVYYHPDTVKTLETEGILRIVEIRNNIDEHAPNFAGPLFYDVEVFTQKVKEKIRAINTISHKPPKPLPKGVNWDATVDYFMLLFSDGKKLEFDDIKDPSAQYFSILVKNHGLWVKHEDVKEILGIKTYEKIRNLVKTLNKKIKNNGLSKKVAIKTEYKSAYKITITS